MPIRLSEDSYRIALVCCLAKRPIMGTRSTNECGGMTSLQYVEVDLLSLNNADFRVSAAT
jgi:hypothetical protein